MQQHLHKHAVDTVGSSSDMSGKLLVQLNIETCTTCADNQNGNLKAGKGSQFIFKGTILTMLFLSREDTTICFQLSR